MVLHYAHREILTYAVNLRGSVSKKYSKVDDSIKFRMYLSIVLYRNLGLIMLMPHVKPGHYIFVL